MMESKMHRTSTVLLLFLLLLSTSHVQCFLSSNHPRPRAKLVQHKVTNSDTTSTSVSVSAGNNIKYPTQRGSEVDIRNLISLDQITAVRLSHVLFLTETFAKEQLQLYLRSNGNMNLANDKIGTQIQMMTFQDLAQAVSSCDITRDEGGTIGWVNTNIVNSNTDEKGVKKIQLSSYADYADNDDGEVDDYLEEILPLEARIKVLKQNQKPGDVILIESTRGFHLVKIEDVMLDVRGVSSQLSVVYFI